MTVNAELALAAARIRELSQRIPARFRPDVDADWSAFMDSLNDERSDGGRRLAIIEFRARYEAMLATKLAHAPLEVERG